MHVIKRTAPTQNVRVFEKGGKTSINLKKNMNGKKKCKQKICKNVA